MKRRELLRATAGTTVAAAAGAAATWIAGCTPAPAGDGELSQVLGADGPATEYPEKMMLFGRLVGRWDMAIVDEAGTARGTWVFGWVLQGRGVQDVLWDERTGKRGTTVRQYDPATDSWRVCWFGPEDPAFVVGEARAEGDEVIIRSSNLDYQMRWIFSDVTADAFRWRAEVLFPDGWRVMLRMSGTRAG